MRMIAAACPIAGYGNTLPLLIADAPPELRVCLLADLNSVALDFVQRIEANLVMRNYKGFLGEKD